ncbi:MAG: HU family DNA-binding protein [Thalassovita sp.]
MARATTKPPVKARATAKPAAKAPLPKTRSKAIETPTPEPVVVEEITPESDQLELRKPELLEMVVERSGIKKRDAKPVVEAMLEVLGESLADGREMNLRPLGKVKIMRMKQLSNAVVLNCKVRQVQPVEPDALDPINEAAE